MYWNWQIREFQVSVYVKNAPLEDYFEILFKCASYYYKFFSLFSKLFNQLLLDINHKYIAINSYLVIF